MKEKENEADDISPNETNIGGSSIAKMICLNFSERKLLDGVGIVWMATHDDCNDGKIIVIPDQKYFVPQQKGVYVALKPKSFGMINTCHDGLLVYKTKVFNMQPKRITEKGISVFESDFFVPPCYIKLGYYNVFFRITDKKEQRSKYALIWIAETEVREKVLRYFRKNVSFSSLQLNMSDIITIESEPEENQETFEKCAIDSISYCIKG